MWWLRLANDLACSKQASIVVLSNWGPEVNNNRVLVVIGMASMSWKVVTKAGMGIEVVGSAVSSSKKTVAA